MDDINPDNAIATADREWRAYIEPMLGLGAQVAAMWPETHDDPQLRQELHWFLYSEIGAGFMTVAYADDRRPDFFPCWSQVFNNGGNINPDKGGVSMYEPMGGSAPKYTGQNVINPIAAIGAMSMLLEHSGQPAAGARVMKAIQTVTGTKMKSQNAGKMGCGTKEVGDLVVAAL